MPAPGWPRERTAGWAYLTGDTLVTALPVALHAVVIHTTAAGAHANVYEGQDVSSGRLIIAVAGPANQSRPINFDPPILCERGLYVDFETNVEDVTVVYSPLAAPGAPTAGPGA